MQAEVQLVKCDWSVTVNINCKIYMAFNHKASNSLMQWK